VNVRIGKMEGGEEENEDKQYVQYLAIPLRDDSSKIVFDISVPSKIYM
jgi:hypothetical protein